MKCVYLKVSHPQLKGIQSLRLKFDPLALKVPPHITLVFPFAANVSSESLFRIIEKIVPDSPLSFTLAPPVLSGDYFYFPLEEGSELTITLHDQIYCDLPPELLSLEHPYRPHLTFGRLTAGQDSDEVLAEAKSILLSEQGIMDALILEKIGADDESIVEQEWKLETARAN